MKGNNRKGFTLIELLIVIAIIGILAVALLPSILSAPASARDAAKQAALSQIAVALEQYNASAGQYPNAHVAAGECMIPAAAGNAQTLLKPYFKTKDIPKIDGAVKKPANDNALQMPVACDGILYCKLIGNRYYLGVAMETPPVAGKGRYVGVAFTDCINAKTDNPEALVAGVAATSVYGILN